MISDENFPARIPVDSNDERVAKLLLAFKAKFEKDALFVARAPGRVNLIGEHIDYCGYAVLPMAIEQDMMIAVAKNSSNFLNLSNTDDQYREQKISVKDVTIDSSVPSWYNYLLSGFLGIKEHFQMDSLQGIDMLVDGLVPAGAGLSSSSAFVCCSALAVAEANGKQLSKLDFANICMRSERYVGTEGGGMDQTISFTAQAGKAQLIEFNPIRTKDISLPQGAMFVIGNSCVQVNKAATSGYNERVAECRLACQVLAKSKGLDWKKIRQLGELQGILGLELGDMVELAKSLHQEPYSKEEICTILDVDEETLNNISLSEKTFKLQSFKLHDRALHVYSEALRVQQFKTTCEGASGECLQALGNLMNQSHESCRNLYECSHPDLDKLVQTCLDAGALGSRLTGAGWGGCTVSLVLEDKVDAFLQHVTKNYYNSSPRLQENLHKSLFVTKPGSGAAIYTI